MAESYLENLLGDRERLLYIARQHWILLARNLGAEILIILLILIAMIIVMIAYPGYWVITLIVGFLAIMLPVFTLVRDALVYSNNLFVVTNRRVIHLEGVFDKRSMDTSLEKVNDVRMTQSAMGRVFNYGDVEILTASELGVNLFQRIADPVRFKTAMLNAKQELEDRDDYPSPPARPVQAVQPPEDIPALLERLGTLHQQGVITEAEFLEKKAELLARL